MSIKSSLRYITPLLIIAIAILGALVLTTDRPDAAKKEPQLPRPFVAVQTVIPGTISFNIKSQGTVIPRTQTNLVSEVSGQIVETAPFFVAGGFFRKDDILLRIDPRNHEAALKQAQAQVAKARTRIETESALAGYALDDWRRLRDLDAVDKTASSLTLRRPPLAEAEA